MKQVNRLCVLSMLLVLIASMANGAERCPVPDMTVTSLQSTTLSVADIAGSSKWLLVYLAGDDRVDGNILNALQVFSGTPGSDRVVVAVAGVSAAALQELVARHEKLAELKWVADADRSAAKALQLAGAPSIVGVDGNMVEWVSCGTGTDQKALRSLLTDWVR